MKAILIPLCAVALLLGAVRGAILAGKELRRLRFSRNENALVPRAGSFKGMVADGEEAEPTLGADDYLVLFTIHRRKMGGEIRFWNRVMVVASQANPHAGANMRYWGVCDSGAECNAYQSKAYFTIVGYLEPFEMRIVAGADADGEGLLYNHREILDAHIPRAASPAAEARVILQRAKGRVGLDAQEGR